jgi:hypothetical protein
MSERQGREPEKRQYPPIYEKVVPIALGILVLLVVIVLLIAFSVILGLFPGS